MKTHLITFGDGHTAYRFAADRLALQARQIGWFDSTTAYDLRTLDSLDNTWFSKHKNFIESSKRGLGYWIWKPKLIYETLNKIPEGDILVYLDCGCELNKFGFKLFELYKNITVTQGLLAFHLALDEHHIKKWTKKYTLDCIIGTSDQLEGIPANMIESGIQFIKNNGKTKTFIKLWLDLVTVYNYSLVNDDHINISNYPEFIDHRHDQSIFTLLFKKYNPGITLMNDNYHPELWANEKYDLAAPICALRNISNINKLSTMQAQINTKDAQYYLTI
jgi:hypothetical protein